MALPSARGTALGSALGLLPGAGPIIASFAAYSLEKKISRAPERFGHGAIEGVASPEAANNAATQTSFIPMLSLGLPLNPVLALLLGALMLHGLNPGPSLVSENPRLFWGLIGSMWIGNIMLVVLNLPLVGLWAKLLTIPYRMLFPGIVLVCCIGVYSIDLSVTAIYVAAFFGVLGYIFVRLDCEPAPLILGLVLGPMLESNLRRAMLLSHGDITVLIHRPISLGFLLITVALFLMLVLPRMRRHVAQYDA
jgi:TctA family transporter